MVGRTGLPLQGPQMQEPRESFPVWCGLDQLTLLDKSTVVTCVKKEYKRKKTSPLC